MQTRFLAYITIILFIISCSNTRQKKVFDNPEDNASMAIDTSQQNTAKGLDSISSGLVFKPNRDYNFTKSEIKKIRTELSHNYLKITDSVYKKTFLDSTTIIFSKLLLNKLLPYWYDTPWDFNGHTSKPKQGTIACGYFVSTTLKDMSLDLNRFKLAQQNPENEAKSIAIDEKNVLYLDQATIIKKMGKLNTGLYFIGLDNHVGYLYIKNNKSYFIHSNYIDGKVMVESTVDSEAFYSTKYYVVKISGHRDLAKKWLTKDILQIVIE